MPVRRDSARPNNPTALGGIAGRFAGRFASADQPRGIRAAASVPGRGTAARARRAPIGPALGARAREFRRNRRARIDAMACGRLRDSSVSGAAAGVNGRRAAGREAEAKCARAEPGRRAACRRGRRRGPRQPSIAPASPVPFATVGPCAPRVWSASLGGAREAHQRRPRQAWGVAARGIEGNSRKSGASSTCCGASVSSLGECPARVRDRAE